MIQLTIIGGYGGMGQLFARQLPDGSYQVTLFGEQDWTQADKKLAHADMVLVAVPIHVTQEVIAKAAPYLKESCVLADLTSIKKQPVQAMLAAHSGPVLGLHPMFGPTISTPDKQVVAVCVGRESPLGSRFVSDLEQLGFICPRLTAEKHDQTMDFIQGVQHFMTFCLGRFLQHEEADLELLKTLASPIYDIQLQLTGRIFDQDPHLYADIILSDAERRAHVHSFVEEVMNASRLLEQGDKAEFVEQFKAVSTWMGEFTRASQKASDAFLCGAAQKQ